MQPCSCSSSSSSSCSSPPLLQTIKAGGERERWEERREPEVARYRDRSGQTPFERAPSSFPRPSDRDRRRRSSPSPTVEQRSHLFESLRFSCSNCLRLPGQLHAVPDCRTEGERSNLVSLLFYFSSSQHPSLPPTSTTTTHPRLLISFCLSRVPRPPRRRR